VPVQIRHYLDNSSGDSTPQSQNLSGSPNKVLSKRWSAQDMKELRQSSSLPASSIPISGHFTVNTPLQPPYRVIAAYDHSAKHQDDLAFLAGQIVLVQKDLDVNWYFGEYTTDFGEHKSGEFPKKFVKIYEPNGIFAGGGHAMRRSWQLSPDKPTNRPKKHINPPNHTQSASSKEIAQVYSGSKLNDMSPLERFQNGGDINSGDERAGQRHLKLRKTYRQESTPVPFASAKRVMDLFRCGGKLRASEDDGALSESTI
jgi:hypothetical protein